MEISQVDVPPQVITEGKVVVPRAAVMTRVPVGGDVILRVLVDEKGGVQGVAVLRGFPRPRSGVDEACIEAVKQNRYKPAMKDGLGVKTWITVAKHVFIPAAS